MSIQKGEISQWGTLKHYGYPSSDIGYNSGDSWLHMPLISLACERLGLNPSGMDSVPSDERDFWEGQFMSEILEIEERIRDNVKEYNLSLKGDPNYSSIIPQKISKYLLNPNNWSGSQNLIKDFELLILGVDLKNKLYSKKQEILDVIVKQSVVETKPERTKSLEVKSK